MRDGDSAGTSRKAPGLDEGTHMQPRTPFAASQRDSTCSRLADHKVKSHAAPTGILTAPGMANYTGRHDRRYRDFPKVAAAKERADVSVDSAGPRMARLPEPRL